MNQSDILKEIRSKTNLSQAKFAEKIGVKLKLISNIEYNKSSITFDLLNEIAKYFPELNLNPVKLFIKASLAKEMGEELTEQELDKIIANGFNSNLYDSNNILNDLKPNLNAGERLKFVRSKTGLSQSNFAKILGTSQNTIKDTERNKQKMTVELAENIEKIYGENFRWILTGKTEISDKPNGKFINIPVDIKDFSNVKGIEKIENIESINLVLKLKD